MTGFIPIRVISIIFVLQSIFLPIAVFSQTDHEFWFVAPAVSYEFVTPSPIILQNLNQPIYLCLTAYDSGAFVSITQPANPFFTPLFLLVNPNSNFFVDLTPFIDQIENKPANQGNPYGIKITANQPITAYYELASQYNTELVSLKGRNALGNEFIIPSQNLWKNYPYCNPPARNVFDIVATEDSTSILILPASDIVGHGKGIPFSIILNKGQTWSGRAISGSENDHLGGTRVNSDRPIAITVSDDQVFTMPLSQYAQDLACDQLIPKQVCGTEYIPGGYGQTASPWVNRIFIFAFEDSTIVNKGGVQIALLNEGESFSFIRPDTVWPYIYLTSNKKILIYYFGGSGPQSSVLIEPPLECTGSKKVVFTRPNTQFDMQVWITTSVENINTFSISGTPMLSIDPASFSPVEGTSQWMVSRFAFTLSNWPMFQTRCISNSKGKFQTFFYYGSGDNFASSQICITDYSSLYLGPDFQFCSGDSALLDAGYGKDSYFWNTGDTTQTIEIKVAGIYWVNITTDSCQLVDTIVASYYWSNSLNLGDDRNICLGDSVLLDAGPGKESYNWNTGDTTQTIWVKTAQKYWVTVPDIHCPISDTVEILISSPPQITTNPLSKTICNGESTNILLGSTVPNPMYHWTASLTSGTVNGFSADSGLVINQILTGSGIVNYNITPKVGNCVGDAVDFVVTVTPGDSVKVAISASANPVCGVTNVTYVTNVTNGGTNPSFQWKVNGINQGSNNAVYSYSPANGDIVSCILSSSETVCVENNPATSNSVTMVVDPLVPVSVSVAPSQNNICQGTSVTFTATPSPLSGNHNYQWTVNGINAGTDQNTFIYSPNNNDVVKCNLNVSGLSCLTNNPDTSQPVTMIVNPNINVSVTIAASANPVCSGISVTFTASHSVPGTITYQWFVNGNPVGSNLPNYTYTPANNDAIHLSLLTTHPCAANNPATSNTITIAITQSPVLTYTLCTDSITTTNAKPIKLKGGIPLGGTYSGPGVNSITGIFTPSIAGVGIKTITYSYTNAGLCSDAKTRNIIVQNPSALICGNPFTDVRDGTVYKTIQLAGQCWFTDNLQYGIRIPKETHQRDNCIPEKYCPTANCNLQTANFYQWDELMEYSNTPGEKGLCPPAWHIPTEAEWNTLFTNWTNAGFAASPLKYSGFSGFNAILSGVTHQNIQYDYSNFATFYWSSTPHGPTKAWAHGMNDPDPSVSRYPSGRNNAFGVRCVKD